MRIRGVLALALLIACFPAVHAGAALREVSIGDDFFEPRRIAIDVGDSVTWRSGGLRPHTVTSDDGSFDSGELRSGDEFAVSFSEPGTYYYHCRFHGRARQGMWGLVVVGEQRRDERDRLFVPDDYPTIQAAVDAAKPGAAVVVRPGHYEESVVIATDRLTLRGTDRFATVLDGGGVLATGVSVRGATGVVVKRLTVRDYTDTGIALDGAQDFVVTRVDVLYGGRFGISANSSFDGRIARSFAYGSGEAALHVGSCGACGVLLDTVTARASVLGVELVDATGVTVRGSRLEGNGVGLLARSAARGGHGLFVTGSEISDNNLDSVPPAGDAATHGYPFGTGVWLAGVANSTVVNNTIAGHGRYGVLVTAAWNAGAAPVNNRVVDNLVDGPDIDLAWDGAGANDCFEANRAAATSPADLQQRYSCSARPFEGSDNPAVRSAVDEAVAAGPSEHTERPPEPRRP